MGALDFVVSFPGFWPIFMNCSLGRPGMTKISPGESVLTLKLPGRIVKHVIVTMIMITVSIMAWSEV